MRREHLRTIGQHPEMFQHVAGSPARRRPSGWDRRGDRQEHGGLSRRHQQLRHFYAGVIAPGTDREASRRATRHTPTRDCNLNGVTPETGEAAVTVVTMDVSAE